MFKLCAHCLVILLIIPQIALGACQRANPPPVELDAYYQSVIGKRGDELKFSINGTWEAPDIVKGDLARALFYMVVRYDGSDHTKIPDLELINDNDTARGTPTLGGLCTISDWHLRDSVPPEERRRSEIIYSVASQSYPFIDHPAFVEAIWGEKCSDSRGITKIQILERVDQLEKN